jgi:hypothetical protein
MKFKMTMVAAVVALATTNLYAQETYNVEAIASANNLSVDDQSKQTQTQIGANYYLTPIKMDKSQPFAELDFLQKANSIGLVYANVGLESANIANTTITPLAIIGQFYIDNLILGFSNSNWSTDLKSKTNTANYYGTKYTNTGINIGYYVTPETAVTFTNRRAGYSYTPSAGVTALKDANYTTNSITSQTVMSMGGSQFLRFGLQYNQITREQTLSEKNNEYGVSLRYYPDTKYYVEGGYLANTGDLASAKGKTLSAGAGIQFTPRFGVLLSTAKFTGDVSTELSSSTSTTLTAGYRF